MEIVSRGLIFSPRLVILFTDTWSDCPSSALTDVLRAVISFWSFIPFLSFQTAEDYGDQFDGFQQLVIDAAAGFYAPQFLENSGEFVPQCLIHSRIALHDHVPLQQPAGNIVLLVKPESRTAVSSWASSSGDTRNATVLFLQRFLRSRFLADIIAPSFRILISLPFPIVSRETGVHTDR